MEPSRLGADVAATSRCSRSCQPLRGRYCCTSRRSVHGHFIYRLGEGPLLSPTPTAVAYSACHPSDSVQASALAALASGTPTRRPVPRNEPHLRPCAPEMNSHGALRKAELVRNELVR